MSFILLKGPDFGIGVALYFFGREFVSSPIVWILAPMIGYLAFETIRACIRSRAYAKERQTTRDDHNAPQS